MPLLHALLAVLDCALFDRGLFPLVCELALPVVALRAFSVSHRVLERGVTRMPAGYRGDEDVFVIVVYCLSGVRILITGVVTRIFFCTLFFVLCCRDRRLVELFWYWQGREHTLH